MLLTVTLCILIYIKCIANTKYYYNEIIGTWVKVRGQDEVKGQIHRKTLFQAKIRSKMLNST